MTDIKAIGSRVERLRRLDCCGVSDALDRLGLEGVATGIGSLSVDRRIAGRVLTVKLGQGAPPPGPPRHLGTTAVEAAKADDIIVVEQRSGVVAGSWGGLLTLSAKLRGVAGIVSDGLVRDIDEAVDLGMPIFAKGCTAKTARGRVVEMGTNVPICVGEVGVEPGDYVIADRSAVIFIAQAQVDRVLDEAEKIVAKEGEMARALLSGIRVSEVMGGNYENLLKRES